MISLLPKLMNPLIHISPTITLIWIPSTTTKITYTHMQKFVARICVCAPCTKVYSITTKEALREIISLQNSSQLHRFPIITILFLQLGRQEELKEDKKNSAKISKIFAFGKIFACFCNYTLFPKEVSNERSS